MANPDPAVWGKLMIEILTLCKRIQELEKENEELKFELKNRKS
jgi:hypothetical protein